MGKVDWEEAQALYVTSKKVTMSQLAKHFKVAKSTIVRRAKNEGWVALRTKHQSKYLKKLYERMGEAEVDINERQLKPLRLAQSEMYHEILRLGHKLQVNGELTGKETRSLVNMTDPLYKVIMAERAILGLRTKRVIVREKEEISAYQLIMGYAEGPPENSLEELNEVAVTLDRMIERKKMIQSMIDESNERGAY